MSARGTQQTKYMRRYSTLAGPIQKLKNRARYTVQYIDIMEYDSIIYRNWTRIIAYGSMILVLLFAFILFQPSHWIVFRQPHSVTRPENWLMLLCLGTLQIFLVIGTYSATRSTLKAKDPLPVRYPSNMRVAFATTRAPGEPIDMVHKTLQAALAIRHRRIAVDAWLLDETNDVHLRKLAADLGVRYFSRHGIARWNTPKLKGNFMLELLLSLRWTSSYYISSLVFQKVDRERPNQFFAAKSKHGNFNAWMEHLREQGIAYDVLAGVDTDHVPEPNYLERLLGYFRDPDVAYVVGPQVYGNYAKGLDGLVVRWAESQASFFQSTIQRAGNSSSSPMFVGTNYAIRMDVLQQIGGFQPCITEDMATGLAVHTHRNPVTGNRWKSVYTPDVVAVGEGPSTWGPYFTQQWRWAAGTFDTWRSSAWRKFLHLSPSAMLHYFLMLTFYPITALTWLFGIVSSMTYLITGATAILAPWNEFVSLYLMSVVLQLSLYFWNRRFNVSPFDAAGTYGVPGMALTSLTAPIYLSALAGIVFGKKPNFVVTKKGGAEATDTIQTFKIHLAWAALLLSGITVGFFSGHMHPAMVIWALMQLLICLLPGTLALTIAVRHGLRPKVPSFVRRFSLGRREPEHA